MQARYKIMLLVGVVLVAVLSAVVWKTRTLVLEDKLQFIGDSSMKQIAPLKRLVSAKLEERKREIVRFAANRAVNGAGRGGAFSGFDVIAQVEATSPNQWNASWIERGSDVRTERWPQGYDLTLLKSLAYSKAKDGMIHWSRLSDAQGAPIFAMAVPVQLKVDSQASVTSLPDSVGGQALEGSSKRALIVGFTSENPLAGVSDDYIGSLNTVYVVDDRGYVASHVDKAFVGALFSEDPIVKEVIKGQKPTSTGNFEDLESQSVLGHYEKIDRTNLSVVITTPTMVATSLADSATQVALVTGGAIGLVGLLLAYLVGGTLAAGASGSATMASRWTAEKTEGLSAVSDGDEDEDSSVRLPIMPAPSDASMKSEELKEERKNAFETFQAEFAARLREPLLAILGQAQLVKSKTDDSSVITHAESIEREARDAKDAIERWQILAEGPFYGNPNETCELDEAVAAALAEKALQLKANGIEVITDTSDDAVVKARLSDLASAIGHAIDNSIEAMRDRPNKKLRMKVTIEGDQGVVLIVDSGVGMSRDVRDRAFEPFFKGFAAPRRMGLGLAFVDTTVKRWNGRSSIDSNPGEGTTLTLKFPLAETKRAMIQFEDHPLVKTDKRAIEDLEMEAATALEEPSVPSIPVLGGRAPLEENFHNTLPPAPEDYEDSNPIFAEKPVLDGFQVKIRRPRAKSQSTEGS